MKITAEQFVESLARLSDEEKQKAANLLVNNWSQLSESLMGMGAEGRRDQHRVEQAEAFEMSKAAENGTKIW